MHFDCRRAIIGREGNVVRVDFSAAPEPPAPKFPGAAACHKPMAPRLAECSMAKIAQQTLVQVWDE